MTDLLINEITRAELTNFSKNPGHALLIAGADGSGRLALAKMLARELLHADKLVEGSKYKLVTPDEKGSISIEKIRELKQFTILKTSEGRRVIIVADANGMGIPAQNSFLKILEEPPENTVLILTGSENGLRPTILSRLQKIRVRPVPLELVTSQFGATSDVSRAFQASGGRLGILHDLLSAGEEHPLMDAAAEAKRILGSSRYERLCLVDQLAKDKSRATNVVQMIGHMAQAALELTKAASDIARWQNIMAATLKAERALSRNSNPKLVLTDLMLNL